MKYDDYTTNPDYIDCQGYPDEGMGECMEEAPVTQRRKMIEVEEVLGTGTAETTVEICVPLRPPAFEIMEDLITKEVIFDALIASKGKVFINGRVIKDIPYKTRTNVCVPGCPAVSKAFYGNVRHVTVEIPFALCIDVPEAFKGAKVVVLNFEVESVEIPNHTNCLPEKCIPRCEPAFRREDVCFRRLFCSLTEKDCISVTVKVVRDTILQIPATEMAQ